MENLFELSGVPKTHFTHHPIHNIIHTLRYRNKIDTFNRTISDLLPPDNAHIIVRTPHGLISLKMDSARKCVHVIVRDTTANDDLHNRIIIKYIIYDGDTVTSETIQPKSNNMIKSRTLSVVGSITPPPIQPGCEMQRVVLVHKIILLCTGI